MKKISLVLIKSPNDNYPDNRLVDLVLDYPNGFKKEILCKIAEVKEIDSKFGKGHTLSSPIERGQVRAFESGTDNESPLFTQMLSVSANGFTIDFTTDDDDFAQEVTTEIIPAESLDTQRHWCYYDEVTGGVEFLDIDRGDEWEDDVYELVHAVSQEKAVEIYMN